MAIDFTLSLEQRELQTAARVRKAAPHRCGRDHRTVCPARRAFYATRPVYAEMVKAGFVAALIPKKYGGTGMSTVDLALATEELAAVDVNVPSALLGTGLGLEPIINYGTEEQKRRFLPDFISSSGERLAAFAFTEVTGGANYDCPDPAAGVQTIAQREGDEWVISGKKHYTTNACGGDGKGADLVSVVCRVGADRSPQESLAIIVVPGRAKGVEVAGFLDTAGHRATSSPIMHFNEVRVPVDNLIGQPGDGIGMCSRTFSWTAALIGAACTGVMRAAFDAAFQFARTDKRSGTVPVIEHQNVGFMLADIKMRIEAARYLSWKACHYLDVTDGVGDELAIMTKVYSSELAVQVVYDTMRLVGVDSYTELYPLAGLMQDALCFPLYDGGNMGVRRRQLHKLFCSPGYDPMAAAESRMPV